MRELTPEYLAGFFEGDGYAGISSNGPHLSAGAWLINDFKPLLTQVMKQYGGGLYHQAGSDCWKWCAKGSDEIFGDED